MSMSTHLSVIKPPDATWKKMKAVWDSCKNAGIAPPKRVDEFFNGEPPDDAGVIEHIADVDDDESRYPSYLTKYKEDMAQGFEVHVDKLDTDIKIIRFVNSW